MSEGESWQAAREAMVRDTVEARGITSDAVLAAMRAVPRHAFVPAAVRDQAYLDEPLPLAAGQSISQPYMVAAIAEHSGAGPGDRVLDVGTGSGYPAAVLAELGAEVYSIECLPALYGKARVVLAATGYERVHLKLGDGKEGWPGAAPFDAIVVAAAAQHVPEALIDQLAVGGRLVAPVGHADDQELIVLERMPWGEIRRRSVMRVRFVPLV